jgi:hypothetical protein
MPLTILPVLPGRDFTAVMPITVENERNKKARWYQRAFYNSICLYYDAVSDVAALRSSLTLGPMEEVRKAERI